MIIFSYGFTRSEDLSLTLLLWRTGRPMINRQRWSATFRRSSFSAFFEEVSLTEIFFNSDLPLSFLVGLEARNLIH